ncbi:glutamate synthase [Paremcibacter congregatus]|uniref:Glutamate synthase n=1 Tax=Paremcibacter congregatus TaxID=2043170 RepID=A0A2G4YQH2_9PROT|nr:CDGSH iron-sulfur domain-containing protein [Paremcibacter congregatus]PHZ84572.1 glutamate synthase [Paremcibacter congregatus]QDE28792.1 CDGSH iron-sulfur domain-containing protein [Paremcibacter congregatus]
MTRPIIAANTPVKVNLKQGERYFFCRCGLSRTQPFCDGSHKGTSFRPQVFTAKQDGPRFLCACKHTAGAPFCDGTHKKFTPDQVGGPGPDDHA